MSVMISFKQGWYKLWRYYTI